MTQDEIIAMAREAGLGEPINHQQWDADLPRLEAFAKLVEERTAAKERANEREACAKVCESFKIGNSATYIDDDWADMCADAIRARALADGGEA